MVTFAGSPDEELISAQFQYQSIDKALKQKLEELDRIRNLQISLQEEILKKQRELSDLDEQSELITEEIERIRLDMDKAIERLNRAWDRKNNVN